MARKRDSKGRFKTQKKVSRSIISNGLDNLKSPGESLAKAFRDLPKLPKFFYYAGKNGARKASEPVRKASDSSWRRE